jgi:exosortase D (VPLPA-CTERM-specific)
MKDWKACLGKAGTITVLLLGIYYSTFEWLIQKDWARDDYSHGMLIPFIVLYLLWEKKETFFSTPARMTWKGLILLLPGLLLFWLGELSGEFFMLYGSCWLVLMGLCWIHMGDNRLKTILFPLFLLLAMFPLPNFVNVKLTFQLRLLSSKIGVMILHAMDMSAYREGNIIDLGFTRLQVVDACSGLRYLFPMIILSILIAYFYRAAFWKKAWVVLSSVPLTILTNALRIAITGILAESFGSKAVEGFFHDFEGWLIFMVTLGVIMAEIWLLKRFFPEPESLEKPRPADPRNSFHNRAPKTRSFHFLVSIMILGITLALSQGMEFRKPVPMTNSFEKFPMKIADWKGSRQTMEKPIITALDLSDYLLADFKNKTGDHINFYVAYYETQQKGKSIHSPATCLRGGGWVFDQNGKTTVPVTGTVLPVNRALIKKGDHRQISYYWFPMRGRVLTNAFEMKWFNFWDALTRQRTDGALVRAIAPLKKNETPAQAEARLQFFLKQAVPVLSKFLPQ